MRTNANRAKQKSSQKNRRKKRHMESSTSEEEWFSSGESDVEQEQGDQLASGPWTYNLDEMLAKKEFDIANVYKEIDASEFTLEYVQKNGLEEPHLFKDSVSSLGMKMPKDGTFTVPCVLKAVGDRQIEVVDVMTQGSRQMMLSDFVEYYETPSAEREELLNVLSLEFSLTPLAKRVRTPALAREIDWVELYWPKELRSSPSTFPKVQHYCLMSVKGSFTDFHIDFGGTSVWYHVYKGRKTFWLIEPKEENLLKYENWILRGTQYEAFFGDLVDKCARIDLYEGYTFIIPSGWIHAVYTPEDSLVFGGNFLHSFSIPMQIRISQLEDTLMIKKKYRYPKYNEMSWYVVENIVKKATGQTFTVNKTNKSPTARGNAKVSCKGEVLAEESGVCAGDVTLLDAVARNTIRSYSDAGDGDKKHLETVTDGAFNDTRIGSDIDSTVMTLEDSVTGSVTKFSSDGSSDKIEHLNTTTENSTVIAADGSSIVSDVDASVLAHVDALTENFARNVGNSDDDIRRTDITTESAARVDANECGVALLEKKISDTDGAVAVKYVIGNIAEKDVNEPSSRLSETKESQEATLQITQFSGTSSTIVQDRSVTHAQDNSLSFNDEYIATISKSERDGYKVLIAYLRELVDGYTDFEAKQNMRNVLDVFEQVLDRPVPDPCFAAKEKKKHTENRTIPKLNHWLKVFGKNGPPVTRQKLPPKEKVIETVQLPRSKPPKIRTKSTRKPDHHKPDGPLIVGGIPPAIMPADAPQAPNPYGYDPLASVTPLGHKQLPSAYRRTPDMAKAPPSQKFRLQPQAHRDAITVPKKAEVEPEKAVEKLEINSTKLMGPTVVKPLEHEKKSAIVAQTRNERSFHHNESWRSHHDRDKDIQRDNRHSMKEEYPELQYRSPLVRPSASSGGTKMASKYSYNSYGRDRYSDKTFRRLFTDSSSVKGQRSTGGKLSDVRRASDSDARERERIKSWRSWPYQKSNSVNESGSFSKPFINPSTQKKTIVGQQTHSAPGDPRLPGEGRSGGSSASKDSSGKEIELDIVYTQYTRSTDRPVQNVDESGISSKQGSWKALLPAGPSRSAHHVSCERIPGASVTQLPGTETEHTVVHSQAPSVEHPLPLSEPQRTEAVNSSKPKELRKPAIPELSVTLNEEKDEAGIMAAAEELAELTRVFEVDERGLEKRKIEPTKIITEQKSLKRQNSGSLEISESKRERSVLQKSSRSEKISSFPKLSRIPTETAIEDLSTLTAEFNAVENLIDW